MRISLGIVDIFTPLVSTWAVVHPLPYNFGFYSPKVAVWFNFHPNRIRQLLGR